MHVITRSRLTQFGKRFADAVEPVAVWYRAMKAGKFADPHEVKAMFGSVDFLGDGKVVFDIGGNKYRLVVWIRYKAGRHGKVYIKHVLTHPEYDRLLKRGKL